MGLNRRRKAFVVVSAFVGAAAIAVPLALGLVLHGDDAQLPVQTEFTSQTAVQLPFGEQPTDLAAPVLAIGGVDKGKYGTGTYSTSTYDKTKSVQDNTGATVTFVYAPATQPPGQSISVTYPLAAQRGKGNTANSFIPPDGEVEFGSTVFPIVTNLADLLKQGNYPYTVDADAKPSYLNAIGGPLSSDELSKLSVGSHFTARYAARLDTANYEGDPVGIFVFKYIIGGIQLPVVANLPADGPEQRHIAFGTDLDDFPVPPAGTQAEHYVLKNGLPEGTITSRPQGATTTPPVGETVFLDAVQGYDAGTVFTFTYTYRPESATYKGANYTYSFVYTIDSLPSDPPSVAGQHLPAQSVAFGMFANTQQPPPPVYAGYDGVLLSTVVTTASSTPNNYGNYTPNVSPATTDQFRWDSVNLYSAGTQFTVTYKYTPSRNRSGEDFTVTRDYTITKQPFSVPSDVVNADSTSYVEGAEFYNVSVPFTPQKMKLVGTSASLYRGAGTTDPLSVDELKGLKAGETFTALWTFELLDPYNYEPQTATDTTYTVTTTFTVAPKKP